MSLWNDTPACVREGAIVVLLVLCGGPTSPATSQEQAKAVREETDVLRCGAKGDGSPGGGDAIQIALDRARPGGEVYIPPGSYNLTRSLEIGKNVVSLRGAGPAATIWSERNIPLLRHSGDHSPLRLIDLSFDAQHPEAAAVVVETQPVFTQSREVWISQCRFTGEGTGISLIGVREAMISDCQFTVGRAGVYLRDCSNPTVIGCFFSPLQENPKSRGIRYDGASSSVFSAGLRVIGCTMMGLAVGVDVSGTDFLCVSSNLIDYCDLPLRMVDQDAAIVQGNYIGARGDRQTGTSAGVEIRGDAMTSQHIKIVDNIVTTYDSTVLHRTGIRARNVHGLTITGNTIHFWNEYGILNEKCQRVTIEGNTILPATENTGIVIARPTSGEAIVPPGETRLVVAHGLGVYPARAFVTPGRLVTCAVTGMSETDLVLELGASFRDSVRVFWKVEE